MDGEQRMELDNTATKRSSTSETESGSSKKEKEDNELNEAVEDTIKCSICFEVTENGLYTCPSHHVICGRCLEGVVDSYQEKGESVKCPTCKCIITPFQTLRNLSSENLVKKLYQACNWCCEIIKKSELTNHYMNCEGKRKVVQNTECCPPENSCLSCIIKSQRIKKLKEELKNATTYLDQLSVLLNLPFRKQYRTTMKFDSFNSTNGSGVNEEEKYVSQDIFGRSLIFGMKLERTSNEKYRLLCRLRMEVDPGCWPISLTFLLSKGDIGTINPMEKLYNQKLDMISNVGDWIEIDVGEGELMKAIERGEIIFRFSCYHL